ncbi:MAG: HEAT repeat domain-containing protein [Planctomycetota bacterium]|nr:HEAT repeat domain-containing protein [Planctomycetota bacterium]
MRFQTALPLALSTLCISIGLLEACRVTTPIHEARSEVASVESARAPSPSDVGLGSSRHEQEVMKSSYCASCHPDAYAEHEQNTHGRAFTDEEVRLATGRFSQADCIICHTPRPIFESGIGQNPIRRHHDLEAGNTCMTCHWKEGADYSRFTGGAECRSAFDPRVGTVEACASCHRNHGTPYQWEQAPRGMAAGNTCIDCHMSVVERPIAVGGPVKAVHSHAFPGGRNEAHLRKAYSWDARLEGNEVVVVIENKGAGHNFPTELKQRSVESVVTVKDATGKVIARSRMTFRDPYKRPYGLTLPVNTQIPSGEKRTHRVPIAVADGLVECELHYKLYYPIEDNHPDLARQLEGKTIPFAKLTPSTKPVESEPEVAVVTPENISPEKASPANLVDYAHLAIGKVEVTVPSGSSAKDIDDLIALFQFPVPQANVEARKKLTAIGVPALPALVAAMGSWDNKTWNQAMAVIEAIGEPAIPSVVAALDSNELYVRLHACEMLVRLGVPADAVGSQLIANLGRPNALDRSHAALAIGERKLAAAVPNLRKLVLEDRDPDVVRAAARSLAQLGAKEAVPDLKVALNRFAWAETRRDLAEVLAKLHDPSGIPVLIAGLDETDDLVRESFFETLFGVTGKHFCYEALAPRDERLAAIAQFQVWWAKEGDEHALRHPLKVDPKIRAEVKRIAENFGGSDGSVPAGDDAKMRERLMDIGPEAVPGLTMIGLKFPAGFYQKRSLVCSVLGDLRHPDAVPALITVLRDPVVGVAAWANEALGKIGDKTALPAVQRYHSRLRSLHKAGQLPASAGAPDVLLAQAAATRFKLGDARAENDLVSGLLSDDEGARATAQVALTERYGLELEYDGAASLDERRAAVAKWLNRRP